MSTDQNQSPVPDEPDVSAPSGSSLTLEHLCNDVTLLQHQLRHAEHHIVTLEAKNSQLEHDVRHVQLEMKRFLEALSGAAAMVLKNPMAKAMMPKEIRQKFEELGII